MTPKQDEMPALPSVLMFNACTRRADQADLRQAVRDYAQQYAEQRVREEREACAREWDGCFCDVVSVGEVDIGAAIRARSKP